MTQEERWENQELKRLDLILENQSLEVEIGLRGGQVFKAEDVEPQIENAFFKSILAFEEADKEEPLPLRSPFPADFEFPLASAMSAEQLSRKLGEIQEVLSRHCVAFGFAEGVPDEVLYTYLVEECIPEETVTAAASAGFTFVLDGCDGNCEGCFQAPYCAAASEIPDDE